MASVFTGKLFQKINEIPIRELISKGYFLITIPDLRLLRLSIYESANILRSLPAQQIKTIQRPDLNFAYGWYDSQLQRRYSWNKNTYEENQLFSVDPIELCQKKELCNNVWPEQIPNLWGEFYILSKILQSCAVGVGSLMDKSKICCIPEQSLRKMLDESNKMKMKLTFNPPTTNVKNSWHRDASLFTLLFKPTYFDNNGKQYKQVSSKLYAQEPVTLKESELELEDDQIICIAGEFLEILSGGSIKALSHRVVNDSSYHRINLAFFAEPAAHIPLCVPDLQVFTEYEHLPSLNLRWRNGMTYNQFYNTTRAMYQGMKIGFYIPAKENQEKYSFLSNFYHASFEIDEVVYLTVEHFYQSQKFVNDKQTQQMIIKQENPAQAKEMARAIQCNQLQTDQEWGFWEERKVDVMRTALRAKFTQNPALYDKLIDTKPYLLYEDSDTDVFWGGSLPGSKNMLGVLLQEIRDKEP